MRAKISANRFEEFGFEARRFLSESKKKLLFICAVFVIGLIIGIIVGATSGVNNCNSESKECPYLVKVTADVLNIRKGAGTDTVKVGSITDRGVYTIVAEENGAGASKWGKLKSGEGWISLDYTKKI